MAFTKTPLPPEEIAERRRARARQAYYDNRETMRTQQNAKRVADPEGVRAAARARRAAKPDLYRAYGRAEQLRRRINEPWLASFHACRKRAAKKGLEFTITPEWARAIYTGRCELTGREFAVRLVAGKPGPMPFSPSIDRKEQTVGYTPANCRFILHAINTMRGSGTDDHMLDIAAALLARKPA